MQELFGQVVDIIGRRIYPATIQVEGGFIRRIEPATSVTGQIPSVGYILPGFIDAHVHIESSMLIPAEFARLAVVHGTVGTVSDPHEIANVCGLAGVDFMIEDGRKVPFKFNFGAPSCVPATIFETAGAALQATDVERLLERSEVKYLSEMMNFPGVLNNDEEVYKKITAAHRLGKPVDGHAPGLRGAQARDYIAAGISTDHECFTREEALEKLQLGMKILIREGSAARNFEALADLLRDFPGMMMFCSDDKHPDSLVAGHINQLCQRAIAKGIDVFNVLQAACINPVLHYKLDIGMMRPGDPADFIVVEDLTQFKVLQTYIDGVLVAEGGRSLIESHISTKPVNQFNVSPKKVTDFRFPSPGCGEIPVIEALPGELITNKLSFLPTIVDGQVVSDTTRDLLKIAVVNRYHPAPVAMALIRNIGLKSGAIASSVAHDSHNIVAVGADDESLCRAVNVVIEQQGGISCVRPVTGSVPAAELVLGLPVAGLMSAENGYTVADRYTAIDAMAKNLGSGLDAPFMTLSFMALLVIPHIKLSDLGLFNGDTFDFY